MQSLIWGRRKNWTREGGGAQAGPSDPQFSSHTRQLSHLQNRISHSPTRGCRYFSAATQVARALATSCCSSLPNRADLEHHRAKQDSVQKGNNKPAQHVSNWQLGVIGEKFHLPKTGNLLCSPSWNGHDGQPPRSSGLSAVLLVFASPESQAALWLQNVSHSLFPPLST